MTANEIMTELESLGTEGYRRILRNHGVSDPMYGVKIEELKKYQKRIKKDHQLALDLYATRNYDAQYLAGLIADDVRMTREDLQRWLATSNSNALCAYTVSWVAAESPHGRELALEWIASPEENTATAGWSTLGSLVSIKPDSELDLGELERLLQRVESTIHQQPNRVRYAMNGFVIGVGCYVPALTDRALAAAAQIGKVTVDMGATDCKVPAAGDYIRKVQARGTIGKKRKTAKC